MRLLIDAGADWRVLDKHTINAELLRCIAAKKRTLLTEAAIGLRKLDLPVLCVREICSWLLEDDFDDSIGEATKWAICKAVKHHNFCTVLKKPTSV